MKEKKLILGYGILNFLITNIFFTILVTYYAYDIGNCFKPIYKFNYWFLSLWKKVFKYRSLNNLVFKKYLFLAIILWFLNFSFIQIFFNFGVNKNITAIFLIPPLVIISYFSQKNFVFR